MMSGQNEIKANRIKNRILNDQELKNTARAGLLRQYAALTYISAAEIMGHVAATCLLNKYLEDADMIEQYEQPSDAIEMIEANKELSKFYMF